MLIEDNNLLRDKLSKIEKYVSQKIIDNTNGYGNITNVGTDYFIGQRSILTEIKKLLL
jgi:hypothetical protein